MEVVLTERFEQAYGELTGVEKRSVRKCLALLSENPKHRSLHVKKMEGTRVIWEGRASKRLRMTFEMAGGTIVMRNVGEHDRVLKRP